MLLCLVAADGGRTGHTSQQKVDFYALGWPLVRGKATLNLTERRELICTAAEIGNEMRRTRYLKVECFYVE